MFTSDHVTAQRYVSAAGKFIPTMLIFPGSLSHRENKDGVPGNWHFATRSYLRCGLKENIPPTVAEHAL